MERIPQVLKIEKKEESEAPTPTPEYWVARPELPFSREYIGLQVIVARKAMPLQALIVSAPIEDFYKKYGVV